MCDDSCFEFIYRQYFAPLCLFAREFVPDQEEDIVNSIFVKLWNNAVSFSDNAHCRNYLYRSVRNACLDSISRQKKKISHEDHFFQNMEDWEDPVDRLIIENEYWAAIYREVHNLPAVYADIIKLSYLDGLKNQEISDKLNLSIQTVKNHKSKGLKLLRTFIAKRAIRPLLLVCKIFV